MIIISAARAPVCAGKGRISLVTTYLNGEVGVWALARDWRLVCQSTPWTFNPLRNLGITQRDNSTGAENSIHPTGSEQCHYVLLRCGCVAIIYLHPSEQPNTTQASRISPTFTNPTSDSFFLYARDEQPQHPHHGGDSFGTEFAVRGADRRNRSLREWKVRFSSSLC